MKKTAVVLFNLGGPDSLDAVQPFLFNLFNDPAIISLPAPLRWLVAKQVSRRRAPIAQDIYRQMGGRSPLLEQTKAQAEALEHQFKGQAHDETRVFIAMRYWHPMTDEAVRQVAAFSPDRVVLLPLYAQFSTTTTGSSIDAWHRAAKTAGLSCPTVTICCYPADPLFVQAHAKKIDEVLRSLITNGAQDISDVQILLSAHGLPKKIVDRGDPYAWQIDQTAAAIIDLLQSDTHGWSNLDWRVCYQSRVGPLEWIGPATVDAIEEAAGAGKNLVIAPIAFVSEHSETLVELDIEYRELAEKKGVGEYIRVPALGVHEDYISSLAELVKLACARGDENMDCPADGPGCCPGDRRQCPAQSA
jgi:ferrochelatase